MKKLFDKNEILVFVIFVVLYVAGSSAADWISEQIGMGKIITILWHICLATALLCFVVRNGLSGYYGLCKPKGALWRVLFYLPLAVIATVNIWFGIVLPTDVPAAVIEVISMLLVGVLEELIFRGLLFRAMAKDNVKAAVIVSSLTFGAGHMVNLLNDLLNNGSPDLLATGCQIIYAIALGFLFCILVLRNGSIWPCILCHGVLNALGVFCNEAAQENLLIPVTLALTVISVGYALILMKTLPCAKEK